MDSGPAPSAHPGMTKVGLPRRAFAAEFSQRLLLVAALLAGEFHPGCALFRRDTVRGTAFAAKRLDAGIALFHDQRLARHGFADQALGLLPHPFLRHLTRTCADRRLSLITPASRLATIAAPSLNLNLIGRRSRRVEQR